MSRDECAIGRDGVSNHKPVWCQGLSEETNMPSAEGISWVFVWQMSLWSASSSLWAVSTARQLFQLASAAPEVAR